MGNWLDFIYVEPYIADGTPECYQKFADFLILTSVPHVGFGLLDFKRDDPEGKLYGIKEDSLIVSYFFKRLSGRSIKISAHPYDGFGDPRWPKIY